jgi:hypothetical protein
VAKATRLCRGVAVAVLVCRGVPVVELNLESTGNSDACSLSIQGKAGQLLPQLFDVQDDPQVAAALAAQQGSSRS